MDVVHLTPLEVAVGKITIRFIGLGVHLDQADAPELPVAHRLVFLANPEADVFLEHPILPHRPELHFPNHARLELKRVILTVPHARGDRFQKHHDTFKHVPRLTPEGGTPLPLDPDVVYRKKEPAAAYFDTDYGLLSACQTPHGAIGTRLEIETNGLPEIWLTSFDGGHLPLRFDTHDVFVTISNMAVDEQDDHFDFLLSYRVLGELPLKAHIPEEKTDLPQCGAEVGGDLGPACSNSSYP